MVLVSEYTVLSPWGVHFVYSPRPKGLSEYTCTPLCDKTVHSLQNHRIFVVYRNLSNKLEKPVGSIYWVEQDPCRPCSLLDQPLHAMGKIQT